MPKMKDLFGKKNKEKNTQPQQPAVQQPKQQYIDREPKEENPQKYIHTDTAGGRNKEMVLHYLGINDDGEDTQLSKMVTPEEVRDIEFSTSVPTGLDAEEVEHFCNTIEANIAKYRELINAQKADKEKLIAEVLRVDRQVQENKQESLMAGQFGDDGNRVNQLNEKVLSLQEELQQSTNQINEYESMVQELRAKVNEYDNSSSNTSELEQEITSLQGQLQAKDKELQAQKAEYEERIAKLSETDDTSVQSENDKLSQQVKSLTQTNNELTEKLNDTSELDNIKKQLSSEQSKNKKLNEEIAKLTSERDNALKISNAANSDGQAQIDEITARYKTAQAKIEKLEKELSERPAATETEEQLRLENLKLKEQKNNKKLSSNNSSYEDEVMKKFTKKKTAKSQAQKLSPDDIKRMKASEGSVNLDLSKKEKAEKPKPKAKPKKSSGDDSFNSMFDDMSNNY